MRALPPCLALPPFLTAGNGLWHSMQLGRALQLLGKFLPLGKLQSVVMFTPSIKALPVTSLLVIYMPRSPKPLVDERNTSSPPEGPMQHLAKTICAVSHTLHNSDMSALSDLVCRFECYEHRVTCVATRESLTCSPRAHFM